MAACISASRIKTLDKRARILFVNDKEHPADKAQLGGFGDVISAEAPRGGNLNGLDHLKAQLKLFASQDEDVVKVDSDVWLNNEEWLYETQGDHVDLLWLEKGEPFTPTGMIYRISPSAAEVMLQLLAERSRQRDAARHRYPEDMTTYHLGAMLGLKQILIPWTRRMLAGYYEARADFYNVAAIHAGEPKYGADGKMTPCSRDQVKVRMQFLAALHGNPYVG